MGWLRDLIFSSPASVRGFDHLAKLCLESASWPASLSLSHRSLGAMLGKLDREEGLEWLAHRPAVQAELAKALGVERGLIQAALTPGRAADAGRLVQLAVLPFAAGVDLLEEDLFPGVPPDVLQPRGWKRLLWVAPNGGGRTLVGRMLAARGLATVTEVVRVDTTAGLPARRPLYVELGDARELEWEALGDGVCVAVTDDFDEPLPDGVVVVRSPGAHELLEPLVGWARGRLTTASTWDPAAMVAALRGAVTSGVARSAGDVLGLIGLADGVGLDVFVARPLSRLAREWFRRRVNERLERSDPTTGWAKTAGYDALVAWVRRAAVEAEEPVACGRTPDAWAALLPADLRRGADLEWLKAALVRAEPSLRQADVDRVSEAMPPGAFRIVRAFEALGLLERDRDDLVSLRPHWLVRVALDDALEAIASGVAFDWGEALLSRRLAPVAMERLHRRAAASGLAGDELETDDASSSSEDPVAAAAVEGAVRALGIAMLGAAPGAVLTEPPEALWNEQLRLLVDFDGVPRPRWDREPHAAGFGGWLLTAGAWHLALLALGEAFGAGEGRAHPVLRPWQAATAPAHLASVLDSIASALDRPEVPRAVVGGAIALVARLRGVLGPLGAGGTTHRLERAAVVADEAALGVLSFTSLSALRGDAVGAAGLRHLLEVRKVAPATISAAAFAAFEQAGQPIDEVDVFAEPELFDLFVPNAPAATLALLLPALARKGSAGAATLSRLDAAQWSALFQSPARVPTDLFHFVPEEQVLRAVVAACKHSDIPALSVLWRRFPAALTKLVETAFTPSGGEPGVKVDILLATTPPSESLHILATLGDVDLLLRARGENLMALRRYLHRALSAHAPRDVAFRETYALFDELERRCAKVAG